MAKSTKDYEEDGAQMFRIGGGWPEGDSWQAKAMQRGYDNADKNHSMAMGAANSLLNGDTALPTGIVTGHPPGMLQDDDRKLSKWLSTRPGARRQAELAAADIEASPAACVAHALSQHPAMIHIRLLIASSYNLGDLERSKRLIRKSAKLYIKWQKRLPNVFI